MPDLLKNIYNHQSIHELALIIKSVYKPFKVDDFLNSTINEKWANLELKARIREIAVNLGRYLPPNYPDAINVIDKVASYRSNYFGLFFPDFVEVYGQDDIHWDISVKALARYTIFSSSEFAVRPFIIKNEVRMMKQMLEWSKDKNEHIRRLASEGCRPQLPWGKALTKFKKDPSPVITILEQLKADPSLYVRKSVANNLNDISKTHPDLILKIAREWYGKDGYSNWIIKHGCRTLLKKGNSDILALFGYYNNIPVDILNFNLATSAIIVGDRIYFSFVISAKNESMVRLEYAIDYVKSSGKRSRKIFQISETLFKKNSSKEYKKSHSFANLSTRKHYVGTHTITLILNGIEREKADFELRA